MSIRSVQKWDINIPTTEGCQTMTKCPSVRGFVEEILSWVGVCVCVCVLVTQSYLTPCELKVDFQVSLSMEFSRQKYWSGLPLPSLGVGMLDQNL